MASGVANVLPTRWGLKLIEWLIILIVIAVIVKFVAPTSGIAIWLTQGFNLAGAVLYWFFVGGLAKLFAAL